jgi:hypothetical protein
MDNGSNRNNLTPNDISIIESEIIEACKHTNSNFVSIDTNQLTKNINYMFGKNYSVETINYVLGFIYEKQFYYNHAIYDI